MSPISPMSFAAIPRSWQVAFAVLVASVFVAYCCFWKRTFAHPDPAAVQAVQAAQVAELRTETTACDGAPLPAPQGPAAVAEAGDEDGALEDDVGDAGDPSDVDPTAQARDQMFGARLYGPYALSVRDGLNDMLLGTKLLAQGVQAAAGSGVSLDDILARVPSQLPAEGYISSGFGPRRSPFTGRIVHHNGVDFAVHKGAPVYATADGVVIYAGWYRALGKTVMIDHGYGIMTRYGHNSAIVVHEGDHVHRGDVIAKVGSTGRSTGPHVHYEVWINDHAIDPAQFMFDLSDRPRTTVALDAYSRARPGVPLGLAMGGDGEEPAMVSRARAALPTPGERLPGNAAILSVFFILAMALTAAAVPRNG